MEQPLRKFTTDTPQRPGKQGIALAVDAWGDPGAPGVLLLHGFGQSRRAWDHTGAQVGRAGYYALAPDARGHGDSDFAADGTYRLDDFVGDAQVLAGGLNRPILVGASMGGMVGMLAEAESKHPLLRALVLVDIVPRWNTNGAHRILKFMGARPQGFASLDEAGTAVAAYLPHRPRRHALEGLKPYLRRTPEGRWIWHWDPRLLRQVSADYQPYHDRLIAAARVITCPTLLVSGSHSHIVDDEAINEFLQAVPHAEHVTVEGARHMVVGDANDAFNDAVLQFIGRLP